MPPGQAGRLSTAADAGLLAAHAGAAGLWLTHLWPGRDHTAYLAAATRRYHGPTAVTVPHLSWTAPT